MLYVCYCAFVLSVVDSADGCRTCSQFCHTRLGLAKSAATSAGCDHFPPPLPVLLKSPSWLLCVKYWEDWGYALSANVASNSLSSLKG